MKKYIITLFIFFMLPTINLYSNFRCVMDGFQLYDFYRINDKLLFTGYKQMLEKDINTGEIKQHTEFVTDLQLELTYFLSETQDSDSIMPEDLWIYSARSFTYVSDIKTNPAPTKTLSLKDIDGLDYDYTHYDSEIGGFINRSDYINGAAIVKGREDLNSTIVYIISGNKLVKVNLDKPDSVLLEMPYSTATDDTINFSQLSMNYRNLLYNSQDSLLWFTNYDRNQIGQYNISTESLTVFDYTKLPVSDKFRVRNYFVVLDSNTGSNNIVFLISENYEPKLLVYNSITKDWEVEEMGIPDNSLIYSNQDDSFCSFLWPFNKNEIAVSFKNENVRSFCIYNRVTKQWRDFEVPIDFFHDENGNLIANSLRSLLFPRKIDWIEKNKSIGILYDKYLIEYTPSSSTDDISTEEGIFQEIGIRSVYPNPIRQSSQVDIMCYVQDLSKIDIGLYDVLGTKILDLNNNYEYNSTTHTITTTIEVPVGTPSGTYYLNVRNGSERRTRVVAIGK